ncbi:translation initiation factor IF-1 [Candidatus Nomurabacteria bacterium]|nr:translation initiation factor IF-1 [Candidatus Nomurabacteria bacterium]
MVPDSKKVIEVEGKVKECLPESKYLIEIEVDGNTHEVIGYMSGRMRKHYIRIMKGDMVKMELTPYDPKLGRIVYRTKA